MALVLADRVLETTTSTGSGTITLAGAEPGYQSFSAIGNANQTYYTITIDNDWEVGIGTYTASGTTLSRDTVLASSNSGNRVTLPAGVKKVFVTYPSEKSVNLDVSGNISLSSAVISGVGYPSADSDAATKLYVDTLAAEGISYHAPVKYEVPNTTGNLTATYNNGTAGVSATLTNAGTLAAFVPDGVTASISDRVLIYNQTNAYENGVYVVSTVGNGSTAWVLTRAADANTYGVKSPTALGAGDAFYVTSGNTGAGETYVCNTPGTIVFGSTAISFVQISAAQVYQAGTGISLTNTTISLVSPVAVATGGTGTTATPTNGQLLIGNGSGYTLSTLTAGSGVSITNSAGSITLSATGLGGTVTAVTASGPLASSGGTTPNISIANATGTGSVVLDQGATISSATITAGVSASITTITGSSANITTVTGTTAGFSSAAITQLSGTSAGITTVSGTTTTFSSGTITQFGATSATITTLSGTSVSYPNANFTSATITNLALTSLTLANLSISSANITTLTGTNLSYASATITTGNLAFSGTAQRITGDFSNATLSNRLSFQTSTPNGNTPVQIVPNGTAVQTQIGLFSDSAFTNGNYGDLTQNNTEFRIRTLALGSGTAVPMTFAVNGSERMRLDTSGNLGIGGSANATARLDLIGTSRNRFDVSTSTVINTVTNAAANAYATLRIDPADYQFYTGGSEKVRIDSSGNVGIGTTSPTANLEVGGSGNKTLRVGTTSNSYAYLNLNTWALDRAQLRAEAANPSAGSGTGAGKLTIWTANAGSLVERMAIDGDGNVGIGKSPTTKLDVSGTITGTAVSATDGSFTSATVTNLNSTSANITTLTGTTFGTTATTQLRGASAQITTLTATSSNITTLTGTTFGTTTGTTVNALTVNVSTTGTNINSNGDIYAMRTGGASGVIYFGNSGTRYLYYDGGNYFLNGAACYINGVQAVTNSGTWGISVTGSSGSCTGNAATATNLSTGASNWSTNGTITATVGLMAWKNYGNNHVIFDASAGTAPNGTAVNNTNPQGNWTASYPTLMGWNGSYTYGVRVDSARVSDSTTGNAATVTNGLYTTGNQTITARTIQQGSQNVGSMLTATGSLGGLELYGGGGTNAAFMTFHRPGAYASYFGLDNDNNFAVGGWSAGAALASMKVGSFGVGTAASGTAGEIRATNNVTAYYSDARLKDFKGKIGNALDKVSQLNGYYYTENAKAEEYGYNNKAMQVGVSAQEVQAVLPEIVTAAPFDIAKDEDGNEISKSGENYMTVRYERLVPLLIEAIKELKAEVEALKANKS